MSNSERPSDGRSARRYRVELPVKLDGPEAGDSLTRDISSNGVFLLTDQPLKEQSQIQFTITLQGPEFPEQGVKVECIGTVVRVESPDGRRLGIAATIDRYCLGSNRGAQYKPPKE